MGSAFLVDFDSDFDRGRRKGVGPCHLKNLKELENLHGLERDSTRPAPLAERGESLRASPPAAGPQLQAMCLRACWLAGFAGLLALLACLHRFFRILSIFLLFLLILFFFKLFLLWPIVTYYSY